MVYFKKIATAGKYHDDLAIHDVLTYITRKDKTHSGNIFYSHESMPHIIDSMISVSKHFGKYSKIRLHHFILTFKPNDAIFLPLVAQDICKYIGRIYQVVVAQHEDSPNPHLHVVFNAVSYINGYKYHGSKEDYYELINCMSSIVRRYVSDYVIPVKYKPDPNNPHE